MKNLTSSDKGSPDLIPPEVILGFFDDINASGTEYLLIKNVGGELPNRLKDGKDIDILVNGSSKEIFERFMTEAGFLRLVHPFGPERGWRFGYGLTPCEFWMKNGTDRKFFIDVSFKLMVKSLTPNYWVPLDSSLMRRVWENRAWDPELRCFKMGNEELLVYLIARSVFDKHGFSAVYAEDIEKLKHFLSSPNIRDMLWSVFYKFTDVIIDMIKEGDYENIFKRYITFQDY